MLVVVQAFQNNGKKKSRLFFLIPLFSLIEDLCRKSVRVVSIAAVICRYRLLTMRTGLGSIMRNASIVVHFCIPYSSVALLYLPAAGCYLSADSKVSTNADDENRM